MKKNYEDERKKLEKRISDYENKIKFKEQMRNYKSNYGKIKKMYNLKDIPRQFEKEM